MPRLDQDGETQQTSWNKDSVADGLTLSDSHRKMLEQDSGISSEVIAARGYRTVTVKTELARAGFSRLQQTVPALLIPIHDVTGQVATHQIRPDEPRKVKSEGGKERTLKYESPKDSRLFLDVNPLSREKLGDPSTPLYVTEGSKKVDALVSHGLCALGLTGVYGFRGKNDFGGLTTLADWESVALNERLVYLAFDSDVVTKGEVYGALKRLKKLLESRKSKVKVIYLPDDGEGKTGVDDYLVQGHSVDDLLKLVSDELRPPPDDGIIRAGPYLIKDGAIYHERTSREIPVALCNFIARITAQNERDDGVERTLTLTLEGKLANGRSLPPAEVSAAQFGAMNWVVEAWGTEAVVYAGMGARDHLRTALQLFSKDVPRRTTYTHFGWRCVDGRYVYLHAGGSISAPNAPVAPQDIEVDAPENLRGFILPDPPQGDVLKEAVRSSLDILGLAHDAVTIPLLASVYRAVLGKVDFAVHLAGSTGAGKSELAAIAQQHYGAALDSRNLPGSWSSTPNALEGMAFATKDALAVIDDFAPEGPSVDIARYHATAARLFRAQGNSAGRGRMRADGSLRPDKPPRGMILSTGEDTPKGHSIRARTIILELGPKDLDFSNLTAAQQLAADGVYASALSGFIGWLAEDFDTRIAAFTFSHIKRRDDLRIGGHRRTVDAGAQLLAALEMLLAFALEVGAITDEEHAALWTRFEAGTKEALEPQAALQSQADPVQRFAELLTGIFSSHRAHVEDAKNGGYPGEGWGWKSEGSDSYLGKRLVAKGSRIGFVEGDDLYLEPSSAYAALQSFAREQGEAFPLTQTTLWKRLHERGIIITRKEPHMTVQRSFPEAGRKRVLHIGVSKVEKTGESGATGAEKAEDPSGTQAALPHLPDTAENEVGQGTEVGQQLDSRNAPAPVGSGAAQKSGVPESTSGIGQTPLAPVAPQNSTLETPAQNVQTTPSEIAELRRRLKTGELKGLELPWPGGKADAEKTAGFLLGLNNPSENDREQLEQLAHAVAYHFEGAN